jgi:ubiquinone/menaquinone biosynthesis C-methylase UbiE
MSFNPRTWYRNDQVAVQYDSERFSSIPGRVFNFLEKRALGNAFKAIPRDAYVLDVPCGTGRITALHLARGCRVMAMDISPQMVRVAQDKLTSYGDRVQYHVGDLASLDLPVGAFDAVSCIRFLCHFNGADRVSFLQSAADVSKEWVVVNVAYSNGWYRLRRRVKKLLRNDNPIRYSVDETTLRKELAESGLEIVRRFYALPLVSEDLILLLRRKRAAASSPSLAGYTAENTGAKDGH